VERKEIKKIPVGIAGILGVLCWWEK